MKILKKCVEITNEFICPNCKSLIGISSKELEHHKYSTDSILCTNDNKISLGISTIYKIVCPECNETEFLYDDSFKTIARYDDGSYIEMASR